MSYQKFKANSIFTGNELLNGNHVLITNENGVIEEIVDEENAGEDIEYFEGILCPGFINCHCHLELSHMKSVVEQGTGLVDFLISVISERNAAKELIEQEMSNADEEMYKAGIVAVGDICNTNESIKTKQQSKLYYHNFIEVLGFSEEKAKASFARYLHVYNNFITAGYAKQTSIVPHAPYTISKSLFEYINNFSAGKIVSIHNQETLAEDELYKTKTGAFLKLYHHLNINTNFFHPYNKSSLQSYLPLLNKVKNLLLVHNTFTTQADIDFAFLETQANETQIFFCLCPNANVYIEDVLPPVELLKNNQCNIVLGTDSYSSNYSLNILNEMKTLQKNFPLIELNDLLTWATLNGAKALGIDNVFGSFETGKKPGVLVLSNIIDGKINEHTAVKRII